MRHARHPDAYDREVGLRVRTLRLSRRMSQNDLGERLGITFQQVQKYEYGANRIGAGRLQRIAEIFGVPVAVQLLEAYGRIGDRAIRRAFLRFAEQVAVTSQRSGRR